MSDIVCPRIENYVHPKKSVWRHTGYYTMSSNHEKEFMEENAIYPTDGIEQQSKNQEPQDAPLDFSVKAANTEHEHHTKSRSSQISIKDDGEILQRAESNPQSSNYPNIQKPTEVPIYNKKSSNTETSKYHDPKQSHTNGSTQKYSEHSPENRPSRQDAPVFHGNPVEHSKFQNSNHHIQETNGESFDCNGSNSRAQSSNVSRENSSPGTSSPSRSILQEVLVRSFDERSPMNGFGPYFQNSSPSASSTKSFRGAMSSCFETNPMLPDKGSLLHVAGATLPVPPMISNFGMLNSFPYQTGPINGMNPFINESLPSISMDTKVFQTPGLCDKKSSKPIRPFKAFTQDPLFGITPIGLPNVIGNMPNSRYFRDYFHAPLKETAEQPKQNTVPKKESSDTSGNSAINSSPTSSNIIEHKLDVSGSGDSNSSYADVSGSVIEAAESTSNGNNRKRSRTLPNEVKDEAYWERRRKNNQAAKRSRDARRQKEDMVAHQAWLFRGMNAQLQSRIQNLENQILILREENQSLQENYRKTDIQLRLAKADITRCKHCASRFASNNSENG